MTPTLLGDIVAEGPAYDKDEKRYDFLMVLERRGSVVHLFRKNDKGYMEYQRQDILQNLTASQQQLATQNRKLEEHRILVNKFAYWFKTPERGDIIVFRVPFELKPTHGYDRNGIHMEPYPYKRSQSVYVKRCVGLPGERVEIGSDNHLYVNDKPVSSPEVMTHIKYFTTSPSDKYDVTVPEGHVLAMGDNSANSADSRYWGPLPTGNLRGKAIARYYPWGKMRFLNN